MSEAPELLPCPFCGGTANLYPPTYSDENPSEVIGPAVINCPDCTAAVIGDWEDDALAIWNRRATSRAAPEAEMEWTPEFDEMVAADPLLSRAASIICGAACGMYSACNSREAAAALRDAGLLATPPLPAIEGREGTELTDDMVVAAMAHIPGCDHDDMVSALEAALGLGKP